MPGLWPTQSLFEEVRHLSDLLSYVCIPGKTARRGKIKLVETSTQKQEQAGENNGD
jgi:hypothetical protein